MTVAYPSAAAENVDDPPADTAAEAVQECRGPVAFLGGVLPLVPKGGGFAWAARAAYPHNSPREKLQLSA
jgi:hypothetical protein